MGAQMGNSLVVLIGAVFSNKTVRSTRVSMLEFSCVARLSSAKNLVDRVGETVILSIAQAVLAFPFIQNIFNFGKLPKRSQLRCCRLAIVQICNLRGMSKYLIQLKRPSVLHSAYIVFVLTETASFPAFSQIRGNLHELCVIRSIRV